MSNYSRQEICNVMSEAYSRSWITTRDGNISSYLNNKEILLITPSGVKKQFINPEDIQEIIIADKDMMIMDSQSNPSGEMEMHWLLQKQAMKQYKTEFSVVHLHPTYTIAAMLRGFNLQEIHKSFPELSRYTKVGKTVPVLPPVSEELAEMTFKSFVGESNEISFDIIGQKGHGVCAVGRSPGEAFEHIERLEHICEIVLASGITPFNIQ